MRVRPIVLIFALSLLILILGACEAREAEGLPTLAVLPTATDTPRELQFWQATEGTVRDGRDTEFTFNAQTGDNIRLRVVEGGEFTATMTLFDASNAILATGDTIDISIPETANYRVVVSLVNGLGGALDVGLSYTDRPDPNLATTVPVVVGIPTPTPSYIGLGTFISNLAPAEAITGVLSNETPIHIYTYDGEADDIVTVNMSRIDGEIDPILTIYNPQGEPLAMDDNSGGSRAAQLLNIRLPEDGTYSVQASGRGFVGSYAVIINTGQQTLIPDPAPIMTVTPAPFYATPTIGPATQDTRIADHVPIIGNIRQPGNIQRFIFNATQGDTVTLAMRPFTGSLVRPQYEVYDPLGELVANGNVTLNTDNNGGLFSGIIPINETGNYFVIVTGESNTTGAYEISYGNGTSAYDEYQQIIPVNTPINGLIPQRGIRDIWEVDLQAGDVITVAVTPQDLIFDPQVEVTDTQGNRIGFDNNSGGDRTALIREIAIQRTGKYLIRVSEATGNNSGSYTLVWRYINAAPTPTPLPVVSTILSVNDAVVQNAYEFYVFQGRTGQEVRIQVDGATGSGLDPVAVLIAPDGREIAQGDDSNGTLNTDFTASLPVDGTYTVRVNGYLSAGDFQLRVAVVLR